MKSSLYILFSLFGFYSYSQTHLIFHKSHSGSKVAYDYLVLNNLLDNTSCGEGISYDEEDRIVKFDSVKVIAPNQVVVYARDKFKLKPIDTNYVANIELNESLPSLKSKMRDNYGGSITDKTIIVKGDKQKGRWKDEKMIPTYLGGRRLIQLHSLLSADKKRFLELTNTTDIPIEFHVYLNSKIINYRVTLNSKESKVIPVKLFHRIENRVSFYLLSDDQTCRQMMYGSLKVTDTKTKSFVETNFDLGTYSSITLANGAIKKGATPLLPFTNKNDFGTKMLWIISITLISLLITLLSVIRARTKWVLQS
jgi:hypothetical protein